MATMKTVLGAVLAGIALLPAGCVAPQLWTGTPPLPCEVAMTWQNHVLHVPDPARGGATNPGLAGRLYLFGSTPGHPLVADGGLTVEMFDPSLPAGTEPVEKWIIHPSDLARLGKKDRIGWGYTVFLPSARLTPAMTRVKLKVAYAPKSGTTLYRMDDITLADNNGVVTQGTAPTMAKK